MTALVLGFAAPAHSSPIVNHDRIVSAVPGAKGLSPAVNDGHVSSIVQIGSTMVVGGTFTSVTPSGGASTPRANLFAFDVNTGALSTTFNPAPNAEVLELKPGPTAGTVYVAGSFTQLNGSSASHVALLNVSDGSRVSTFKPPTTNGSIYSLAQVTRGGQSMMIMGGTFSTAGGVAHVGLAAVNATTGALSSYMNNQVSGHHNDSGTGAQGAIGVRDLDVTPDGSRLVAIGNFKRVDTLLRDQLVMITLPDTSTPNSSVVTPDWTTTRYSPYCASGAFDSYMRGLSVSPDGSYFVVTATGGYKANTLCDAAARFEVNTTGTDVQPTWVTYTGGDTLWSNVITEKAVYVGGHQRWLNNSFASDQAGPGAVPRPGLAALNIQTGIPMKWNPGRNPRGAAVYALYATPTALWMGSDTSLIGSSKATIYNRPRLAFFPLATGQPEASDATASLPGTAFLGGNNPTAPTNDTLRGVHLSTSGADPGTTFPSDILWSQVRGSFMAGGKLWYGKSDNTFNSRTYSNGSFGPEVKVDPYNDPIWAGVATGSGSPGHGDTFDGKQNALYAQLSTVTGMAYANGRLYYTKGGDANLYWRWFNTDSGIIGADQFSANGGQNWSKTLGMFITGGKLYFATTTDGSLRSELLVNGVPTGSPTVVDSGNDWRSRALFLVDGTVTPANQPPTAAFTSDCPGGGLDCTFTDGSSDPDGTVSSYDWDFGDSTAHSTAQNPTHHFSDTGTYQVTLTVTDNSSGTGSVTRPVSVTNPNPNNPISFVAGSSTQANASSVSVTVPTVQDGDTLVLVGNVGASKTATPPAGWTLLGDKSATTAMRSIVWTRAAQASDSGSSVKVTLDAQHRAGLTLAVYRGLSTTTAVTATGNTDVSTSSHTTPQVTVPGGSWVVSAWTEKGTTNTSWTIPGTLTKRVADYSTAGTTGGLSSQIADPNQSSAGTVAGSTATSTDTSSGGVNWSIVLPAP